ncbi:hypothetical protein DCC39_01775 [Pueribacillus theae]|uniref:Uncharacterized protein n=1 Tax=Pueribacillus theae TaxID=2171751 RepID=A0A2U1K826_9BACI|nr:hypothetical protein DCC39_01775 [Pueribacillus theae]
MHRKINRHLEKLSNSGIAFLCLIVIIFKPKVKYKNAAMMHVAIMEVWIRSEESEGFENR